MSRATVRAIRTVLALALLAAPAACAASAPLPARAIELNRDGAIAMAGGDLETAEARVALALEYNPRFTEAWVNLGLVEMMRGNFERALRHLVRARDLNPDLPAPHHALGLLAEHELRGADAEKHYRAALKVDPGFAPARINLARLLFERGALDEAREHFLRATQVAPGCVEGWTGLSETLLRLGRIDDSDEVLVRAHARFGADPLVELLGPDGLLLARDDDSGGGLNSFLQGVLPQDGEYTLAIRSARDDCAGEYLLTLENGWGEQSVQRGPLPLQTEVSGALSVASGARRDVWSFPATAGQRMTLILDTDGPTRVQVANPSGDWEVVKSTRGRGLGVTFEPSQTGTYEAVVFADTSRPIQYRLTLEPGLGRLISDKGPVPLGQRVEGEIRYAEARDRYTFEGRQGQRVRITLDRPGRSQLDPYLELLDPDGRTLAEDDDSGGDLNSLIDVTLPRTGTYTVVARGLGDTTGPYVLTVTLSGGEPTPTPSPSPSPTPTGPPATPSPTPTRGPAPPSPTPGPR